MCIEIQTLRLRLSQGYFVHRPSSDETKDPLFLDVMGVTPECLCLLAKKKFKVGLPSLHLYPVHPRHLPTRTWKLVPRNCFASGPTRWSAWTTVHPVACASLDSQQPVTVHGQYPLVNIQSTHRKITKQGVNLL